MNNFVTWFEIPAADIQRAVNFYSSLFGYELTLCEGCDEKMAFFPEGKLNVHGAISYAKDFNPSTDGVLIYFSADNNLDEKIDLAVKLGGEIIKEKTKIEVEGAGSFALIKDSEGNRIGLYQ